jgi:hypothetical protein
LGASSPQTLDELDAQVVQHKRAIRHHKARLHEAAEARDRLIEQLKQLGIVVEQAQGGKTHGRDT